MCFLFISGICQKIVQCVACLERLYLPIIWGSQNRKIKQKMSLISQLILTDSNAIKWTDRHFCVNLLLRKQPQWSMMLSARICKVCSQKFQYDLKYFSYCSTFVLQCHTFTYLGILYYFWTIYDGHQLCFIYDFSDFASL